MNKLVLRRETVRKLTDATLETVVGGCSIDEGCETRCSCGCATAYGDTACFPSADGCSGFPPCIFKIPA